MRAYHVPVRIVQEIVPIYNGARARVLTSGVNTDYFEILTGVLEDKMLEASLFAIVLDYTMRQIIDGREEQLGFKLDLRKSRRQHPTVITDTGFADDIALITELHDHRGHEPSSRTSQFNYNQDNPPPVLAKDGSTIKTVDNFKYLCAWIHSSGKDFLVRKAWLACHKLWKARKSNLSKEIKRRFFLATVEMVLLYGSKIRSINKLLCKRLGRCYNRMLRMAMNISCKQKLKNQTTIWNITNSLVKSCP